ncbi:hypothetical protein Poli38472_012560 [Pythium oligandrum]|uniref:Metalloendopeptidase n=1 Tax=Pythium oligandrum TaxID=41045 RepID=A0A8K1CE43_PYTOL|nr:hypothetical protein Poli38472_012560 [Pythium oligandrum]|eukprot:TMW61369.1 hypothetical protein Poli38472_012560 [Pythium oligandrum]
MVRLTVAAASAALAFAGHAAAQNTTCTVSGTDFDGFTHYLVGQHRLPGSIYADCHDGTPTCYVDDGISDTADAEVDCGSVNVESRRRELGVFVSSDRAWPNRVVCYKWGAQFSDKAKGFWNTAFKTYQEKVDITWIESSKCRSTYGENTKVCNNCQTAINIQTSKAGCYAHLGYIPNKDYKPELNVGNGCEWLRIYTHEMGHSVGLIHEHSHPKREVIVLRNKLRVGSSNYVKDTNAPTSTYDRMSIMHYDGDEMCIPKDPKIKFCDVSETEANGCVVPKDEHCDRSKQDTFGRGETLTARDIEAINKLYEKEKRHEKSPGGGAPAPAPAPAPKPAPAPAPAPKPAPAPAPKPAPAPAPAPAPKPAPKPAGGSGGYVYVGPARPDSAALDGWCNMNCPHFCPSDMCKKK